MLVKLHYYYRAFGKSLFLFTNKTVGRVWYSQTDEF